MKREPSFDKLVRSRLYGDHRFDSELSTSGVTYCYFGCGCYWSKRKKGGPIGLDPVDSRCPNNPLNGVKLSGNLDHEIVVKQRLEDLYEGLRSSNELKEKILKILGRLLEKVSRPDVSINDIRKILKLPSLPKKRKQPPKNK